MFQTNSKFPLLDISVTYTYLLFNWREIRIGEFKTKGIVFSHTAQKGQKGGLLRSALPRIAVK